MTDREYLNKHINRYVRVRPDKSNLYPGMIGVIVDVQDGQIIIQPNGGGYKVGFLPESLDFVRPILGWQAEEE